MKPKSILTAALLLFVVASVVALVAKEMRHGPDAMADAVASGLPTDGLVAYYFHGNVRCPTCQNIEAYTHQTVTERFAGELSGGRLVWQVVNYETPAAAHYVDDYQIVAPIVVLSQREDGRQTDWRSLERVWELVGDQAAFAAYVEQEVRQMLAAEDQAEARVSLKNK